MKNYRENVLYREDVPSARTFTSNSLLRNPRENWKGAKQKKIFTMFFLSPPNNRRFPCYNESMAEENFLTVFHSKRRLFIGESERVGRGKVGNWERKNGKFHVLVRERVQVKSSQVRLQHFHMHIECIHQLIKNSRHENKVNKPNEFVEFSIHLRCDSADELRYRKLKNSHRSRRTQFLTLSLLDFV